MNLILIRLHYDPDGIVHRRGLNLKRQPKLRPKFRPSPCVTIRMDHCMLVTRSA
jgi:hypothetical protein